jgi:cytochrome c5
MTAFLKAFAVTATLGAALFGLAGTASAQTAADNIRPARSVCLAGQACVGSKVGMAAPASAPVAASTTAPATTAEAAPVAAAPADDAPMVAAAPAFDAEAAYMASCNACHAAGVANAPKLGDKTAWDARLEKGMDALMVNVMNGINAMPAKGLCMTCTQENLQDIVNYMVAN